MSKVLLALAVTVFSASLFAQQATPTSTPTDQQKLDELKSRMDSELAKIQQLQQQLAERERELRQLRQEMGGTAAATRSATNATATATSATTQVAEANAASAAQSASAGDEKPASIRFRGITLTPGGFLDLTGIYRSHNQNADTVSTFGAIPFSGTANAHLSEFRASARSTRLSLLAEGKINDWKASGYAEIDFEGAAPTANELESNSFNPRARQLWAQLQFNNGLSIAGGQTWSLLTTSRKGLDLRQEFIPATIDLQYVVGYNWARQAGIRVTKKFGDKTWAAFSVENPETSLNVTNPPANVFGFNTSPNATTPASAFTLSNTPGANGISTDVAPDLIAKVVFEPGWGHYEVKALGRFFRDRFNGNNNYTGGGGGGIAAILPVTKKLDVIGEALAGTGIGRYASGLGPDVTLRPDATIVPIRTLHTMAGVEFHPAPRWDWYVYGGDEYYSRTSYINAAGAGVGYGSPLNNNSGCELETPAANQPCQAQTRTLWQLQPGFWYRFYKGDAGTVAMGMSYSYTNRDTWRGLNDQQPKGIENIVMTSFRYYFP